MLGNYVSCQESMDEIALSYKPYKTIKETNKPHHGSIQISQVLQELPIMYYQLS